MEYKEKLKHPMWQMKRLKIMERDNFTCVHCRDNETTLHVHHKKYTGDPWEAPDEDLETVCEDCHSIIDDIESMYNSKYFKCIKILKIKNVVDFDVLYIVKSNEGFKVLEGVLTSNAGINGSFIKKEILEYILKILNNG